MRSSSLNLLTSSTLLLSGLAANAATISFNRVSGAKSHSASHLPNAIAIHRRADAQDVSMFMDGVYTANITLGGREYKVILDTSSADLWVDHAPETGFTDKGTAMTFEYAYSNGSLIVDGTVGTAPLTFGTYKVDEQAFLDVHDDGEEFLKLTGVNGILGLGLDRIHSSIDTTVKEMHGADATWGSPLLRNIFSQSHDADNYVSLDLARTEDGEDVQGGTITIGDFEDGYDAVLDQSKVSVYPEDAKRWTIVVDGVTVNGKHIELKSDFPVMGAVALVSVDFAAPGGYVPESVLHDIYGNIEGAEKYDDGSSLRYIVPCNAAPNVTYLIGGNEYPLHPLDLSRFWDERPQSLQSYTVCISSLKTLKEPQEDHDLCLGGAFLRNVYTVFDFGDKEGDNMGVPYVQFLSEHDHDKAHQDFATHRKMDGRPEELKPSEALERLESDDTDSSDTLTLTPIPHPSALHSSLPTATASSHSGKNAKNADGGKTNVLKEADGTSDSSSSSSSSSESGFAKWAPAVLGLLGANLLIMLVLLVLGVMNYIKRNGSGKSGSPRGSPMSAPKAIPHYILGSKKRESSSSYQPVGRPSFVERRDSEVIFDSEASAIPAPPGIAVNDRYDPYDAPSRARTPVPPPPPPPPPPPGLAPHTSYDPSRSNTTATSSSSYSQESLSTIHAPHRP